MRQTILRKHIFYFYSVLQLQLYTSTTCVVYFIGVVTKFKYSHIYTSAHSFCLVSSTVRTLIFSLIYPHNSLKGQTDENKIFPSNRISVVQCPSGETTYSIYSFVLACYRPVSSTNLFTVLFLYVIKGWWPYATLFVYFYFSVTIHTFIQFLYVMTVLNGQKLHLVSLQGLSECSLKCKINFEKLI